MRSLRALFAVGVVCLGLVALTPSDARAQNYYYWRGPGYGMAYSTPYYPPAWYAPPVYSYHPGFYTPPYYWSSRYFVTPYGGKLYSDLYYPWTNQYLYQYRYFR